MATATVCLALVAGLILLAYSGGKALRSWPPRDWRMMLALVFLAGGGLACTALAYLAQAAIAGGPWPAAVAALRIRWLGYLGAGALGLIGIVLTGFATVLGRRAWRMAAGPVSASAEGGEDDSSGPAAAVDGAAA